MKVYSIAPGLAFVDVLAAGLLERAGHDPLCLSEFTVLLPTRRAIRALKEAFLKHVGDSGQSGALLLPRLMALGDLDEEELILSGGLTAEIPPVIDPLRRCLLLARLVIAARPAVAWDQAVRLARELGRFLDQMQTEGVDFDRLKTLAPEDYAHHWGEVLTFLNLLADHWPGVLADEKAIDPATRRNLLLDVQAETWRRRPPPGPVVAAGSTGSIPATARLLKTIAALPLGAVVLPGLDQRLDEAAWNQLEPSHPQFGMKRLLEEFGVKRAGVREWRETPSRTPGPRLRLISEAFRPAAATETWRELPPLPEQAIADFHYLEAPDPQTEALAVALLLREAAEKPMFTAALATPDRQLARRVAAELERWDIVINDSAGQPLAQSPPGVFLRLILEAVADNFAPLPLLSLLKHPLAGLGMAPARLRHLARDLEMAELRGPRPAPGLSSLLARHGWLQALDEAARPLCRLIADGVSSPLEELVGAHLALAETLAADSEQTGAGRLWAGEAGEAMQNFMADLLAASRGQAAVPGAGYGALLEALLEEASLRPAFGMHPRLHIWGPLEARLQQADLLILSGLNEGTWPADPPADPWLSRPMRESLGLDAPERRIGLAAHDAAQGMCAPFVILTRSARDQGAPTRPSRFLKRLEAVMNASGLLGPAHGEGWRLQAPLDWAQALDRVPRTAPAGPPAPCPPLAARPSKLSVTRIETWMRDPYALYARQILKLAALDPIDADPGAADYGTLIHKVLELYVQRWPDRPPADIEAELLRLGEETFAEALERPGVWAFWWPRFKSIAGFVAATERERAGIVKRRQGEKQGELSLGGFTLTAKADRIDMKTDGTLALIDYKTGTPPGWKQVKAGFAPQLPLEAAMLLNGAFADVPKAEISELAFWKLSGGQTGGEAQIFKEDVRTLAQEALKGLQGLIEAYRDPASCYHACPTPGQAPGWSDYEHLERRQEWQSEEEAS